MSTVMRHFTWNVSLGWSGGVRPTLSPNQDNVALMNSSRAMNAMRHATMLATSLIAAEAPAEAASITLRWGLKMWKNTCIIQGLFLWWSTISWLADLKKGLLRRFNNALKRWFFSSEYFQLVPKCSRKPCCTNQLLSILWALIENPCYFSPNLSRSFGCNFWSK